MVVSADFTTHIIIGDIAIRIIGEAVRGFRTEVILAMITIALTKVVGAFQ